MILQQSILYADLIPRNMISQSLLKTVVQLNTFEQNVFNFHNIKLI